MILRPCPFCRKKIPRAMTVCPYCHRDEQGQPVSMDSAAPAGAAADKYFESDLEELASPDPFVSEQAVIRMGQRGFGVVQALISILNDFAKPGLSGVARSLGKIKDRRAIPVLAQAAKMGDDELRMSALCALAEFHEPEVLPILLSEAEKKHPLTQSFLAHALGHFQDGRVTPVLGKLASHSNREIAFQAACALGETGDPSAIPALRKSGRHRDPLVRSASAASLRRLGGKPGRISSRIIWIGSGILAAVGAGIGCFFYR